MTPAEIHQAKRAHVRQQAERWAAAADTTGNHALSSFVQLVRDALRDLEALEASQRYQFPFTPGQQAPMPSLSLCAVGTAHPSDWILPAKPERTP